MQKFLLIHPDYDTSTAHPACHMHTHMHMHGAVHCWLNPKYQIAAAAAQAHACPIVGNRKSHYQSLIGLRGATCSAMVVVMADSRYSNSFALAAQSHMVSVPHCIMQALEISSAVLRSCSTGGILTVLPPLVFWASVT